MSDTPFDGPALQDSTFSRSDMARTRFEGVNLAGAEVFAHMPDARFRNCNMAGTGFSDINLSNVTFDDVDLSQVTITNARLQGGRISGASLRDMVIEDCDLTGMVIDGILVSDLLAAHAERQRQV